MQHLQVLIYGPAKTEARIEDEVLAWHARGLRDANAFDQAGSYALDHVYRLSAPLVVHYNGRYVVTCCQCSDLRVMTEAPDIVDQVSASFEGSLNHRGAITVDADGQVDGLDDGSYRRDGTVDFLRDAELLVACRRGGVARRASRLAADVDEVGAFCLEAFRLFEGRLDGCQTITRERVRGHVNDAHDVGAFAPFKAPVTQR